MKKLSLLLSVLFLAGFFVGCSPNDYSISNFSTIPDFTEPVQTADTTSSSAVDLAADTSTALTSSSTAAPSVSSAIVWSSEDETVTVSESYASPVSLRQYQSDTASFNMYRIENPSAGISFFDLPLSSSEGTVFSYDPNLRSWSEYPLTEGVFIGSIVKIRFSDGSGIFCDTPKSYEVLEGCVLHQIGPTGAIKVVQKDDGLYVQCSTASRGDFCDCSLYFGSMGELMPSEAAIWRDCADIWASYTDRDEAKWCFDGFYYTVPASYIPTGPDCYYRCTASYILRLMWEQIDRFPEAKLLTLGTLDTIMRNQEESGYWLTLPACDWLVSDYHIGSSFYDTRFNTCLMDYTWKICQSLNTVLYEDQLNAYANFFVYFAANNHRETAGGGWLVADYDHIEPHLLPHTSLNHQLAEILTLYHLSDLLLRSDLKELANIMLQGIRDTGTAWVKEDHNLHYRINPDGTYEGNDYPRLTYNDLNDLQAYLVQTTGQPDETIAMLISEKWTYICNTEG